MADAPARGRRAGLLVIAPALALGCIVVLAFALASPGESAAAGKAGVGFELRGTSVKPKRALLFGERRIRLRYSFDAHRRTGVRIRVVRSSSGKTVRTWRERKLAPRTRHSRKWDGLNRRGKPSPDGRYEFRVGPAGGRDRFAGSLALHGHSFPVDGPHGTRGPVGEFGAGRTGGRTHEGFDILADCGTPLVAARGGKVEKVGYDDALYGYYVRIGGRKIRQDTFYSHLIRPARVKRGQTVATGERIGEVGKTGNARTTPCHLHFEIRVGGRPINPEPKLRRWDRYS